MGNSVNVAVVKCVMQALFGVTEQHQNSEEEVEKEEKLLWFPLLLIDQVAD